MNFSFPFTAEGHTYELRKKWCKEENFKYGLHSSTEREMLLSNFPSLFKTDRNGPPQRIHLVNTTLQKSRKKLRKFFSVDDFNRVHIFRLNALRSTPFSELSI